MGGGGLRGDGGSKVQGGGHQTYGGDRSIKSLTRKETPVFATAPTASNWPALNSILLADIKMMEAGSMT